MNDRHVMTLNVSEDGCLKVTLKCLDEHLGAARPCASWIESKTCACECDECASNNHDECEEDYVAEIGKKWCASIPIDQCNFQEWIDAASLEVLDFGEEGIDFTFPVRLSYGWDDEIKVEKRNEKEGRRMTRAHDPSWWDTLRTRKEIRRELRNMRLDALDRLRELTAKK